jgi:hypothetical protein
MSFAFEPELFEHRTDALGALADSGFDWLSHFSCVDLCHDVYGLEVCGIADREDARQMERLLRRTFPTWRYSYMTLKDWGDRDLGWRVVIHRDRERPGGNDWSAV